MTRTFAVDTYATGGAFFESPRWHAGRLWVSDFWAGEILAFAPNGAAETVIRIPGSPGGLGWSPDGTLLAVSIMDRKLWRVDGSGLVEHADLSAHGSPQCNDMVVDATGRAYIGTIDVMGSAEQPATDLVRVDPDGSVAVAAHGLSFPNGAVITPDGSTLVVAESWAGRLTAFDITVDGTLTNRRVWADLTTGCAPDGLTLDAKGSIWAADAAGQRAIRVRAGGEILDQVHVDGLDLVACTLGGSDGRTLYLCATPDFRIMPDEAARTRPATILTRQVDVPHAGLP